MKNLTLTQQVILARIFHTHLLRPAGRPMDTALNLNLDLSGMYSCSQASKFKLCLVPSAFAQRLVTKCMKYPG